MNSRQTTIIEMLGDNQRIGVRELSDRFGVSEMTIRRDLTELEEQGLLVRTHGGATVAGRLRVLQSAFPHYSVTPEKEAIGKLAASLVEPGQTIMIDAGTTPLEVAMHLPQDEGITVVTTSVCVAQALFGSPVRVLMLGGFLRHEFPSLYGPLTENTLKNLHVDTLFIGCDGADSVDGMYALDLHIVNFERAIMQTTDKVVVVAESQKFAKKAFARYGGWNEVHVLVTDPNLSPKDRANLESYNLELLMADPA
ncbi:MAG: DeoR/GlpR family DNA-binding transcription regulator [Armatimonadota bacterium]|nr:DeoR/GlpR family DNA-binding transcription regulator [bacterium]